VLPKLASYYEWLRRHARGLGPAGDLYCQTDLGSGMDNPPPAATSRARAGST
jgi:hypothetical protein